MNIKWRWRKPGSLSECIVSTYLPAYGQRWNFTASYMLAYSHCLPSVHMTASASEVWQPGDMCCFHCTQCRMSSAKRCNAFGAPCLGVCPSAGGTQMDSLNLAQYPHIVHATYRPSCVVCFLLWNDSSDLPAALQTYWVTSVWLWAWTWGRKLEHFWIKNMCIFFVLSTLIFA